MTRRVIIFSICFLHLGCISIPNPEQVAGVWEGSFGEGGKYTLGLKGNNKCTAIIFSEKDGVGSECEYEIRRNKLYVYALRTTGGRHTPIEFKISSEKLITFIDAGAGRRVKIELYRTEN